MTTTKIGWGGDSVTCGWCGETTPLWFHRDGCDCPDKNRGGCDNPIGYDERGEMIWECPECRASS